MSRIRPNHQVLVGEKVLYVFDGVFSKGEIRKLEQNLNYIPAFRKKVVYPQCSDTYQIKSPLKLCFRGERASAFKTKGLYCRLDRLVKELYPRTCLERTKAYCQKTLFGQQAYRARYSKESDSLEVIAMVQANESWDRSWGGELLLYNRRGDAIAAVSHIPGRVLILESSVEHCLSVPQKICYVPQLTVTLHYNHIQRREHS